MFLRIIAHLRAISIFVIAYCGFAILMDIVVKPADDNLDKIPSIPLALGIALIAIFARIFLGRKEKQLPQANPEDIKRAEKTVIIVGIGIVVGAFLGFLLRPSVVMGAQLPFSVVITRGMFLNDLDKLLLPAAQTSFNYLLFGAIVGGIISFVIRKLLNKK